METGTRPVPKTGPRRSSSTHLQDSDKKTATHFKIKSDFIFYCEKRLVGFIQTKKRETGRPGLPKGQKRGPLSRQDRQTKVDA